MIPPIIVPITFKEIANAIKDSIFKGKENILEFEQEISRYSRCEYSILNYSGRTALYTLLKAYNIKKDDEIILPSFMCETVSQMLLDMGLKLNFVDINPNTYNIEINDLNKRISKNTKAILAVHMFGIPCDMQAIMDLAQEKDSIVIEDAAQAMGAEYKGKKAGTIAEAGFFSFGRGKPITAMGGGAIVTKDSSINRKCQDIISSFKEKSSNMSTLLQLIGYSSMRNRTIYNIVHKKVRSEGFRTKINLDNLKYRFIDLQAAIGIKQLSMLDEFNTKRISNAEFLINNLKNSEGIGTPNILKYTKPIMLRFPIRLTKANQRDKLKSLLEQHGIETSIVYPLTLPNLYNANSSEYIGAEEVVKNFIALPTHPLLNHNQLEIMVNDVMEITNK